MTRQSFRAEDTPPDLIAAMSAAIGRRLTYKELIA
jgi:hypothetical protein